MRPVVIAQASVAGGAEMYLVRLYSALRQRGDLPLLLGGLPGWAATGLPLEDLGLGPKWGRSTLLRGVARLPWERDAVRRRIASCEADLFHVQYKREQIGLTDVLARHAPVLWTEHGRFPQGRPGRALAQTYRHAAGRVSAIVCVSSFVADDVRQAVGPRVRVEVIENAVDTRRHRPPTVAERTAARRQLGLPADEPVLAWVGRLHPDKLPQLAVQVGLRFPGSTILAGSGTEAAAVERSARGSRIRLLGHLSDPTPVYRAADTFLFTSTGAGEGLPTVLLEAAAAGLPIIANTGSGMGSLVEAAGGLVAADTEGDLRVAIHRALAESGDRSRMARAWAEARDASVWTRRHAELMSEIA